MSVFATGQKTRLNATPDETKTFKILIVDDIPANIRLLESYLVNSVYELYQAKDGEEAIQQIEAVEPDLILLDIMMPKMNGYDTCRLIKKSEKGRFTPVIMVTALNEGESQIRGIESGADDFISKPINKYELRARVKSLLRIKTLHDQLQDKIDQLERTKERLRQLAIKDGLTGLYNYRHLKKTLNYEVQRSERHKSPFSLIMFDIDHFKKYNDTFGHLAGDKVLQIIAKLLVRNLRRIDTAARYGGEEFAVLLPNTVKKNARVVAEKLRTLIERYPFPYQANQSDNNLTISLGLSNYPADGRSFEQLVECADKRLYRAKASGRNQVIYD